MSLLDPVLASRLDRLATWAHRHHRFAHHPLCDAYARERIRLGRYEICRGCAMAAGGTLAGLLGGLLAPAPSPVLVLGAALAGAALGLAALSWRVGWGGKTVGRALPAAMAGFVVAGGLRWGGVPGLLLTATTAAAVGLGVALYRRRGPWRVPCTVCPERDRSPCPGFRLAYRRERAFQRLVGRWIAPVELGRVGNEEKGGWWALLDLNRGGSGGSPPRGPDPTGVTGSSRARTRWEDAIVRSETRRRGDGGRYWT